MALLIVHKELAISWSQRMTENYTYINKEHVPESGTERKENPWEQYIKEIQESYQRNYY